MPFSRREFLQQTSGAAVAGLAMKVPFKRRWSLTAGDIIPAPDEAYLRELVLKAMDAARMAGATFADIRLTAARYFGTGAGASRPDWPPQISAPMVGFPFRYGIRAIVDGAWGFASETATSPDAVVATARTAVAVARANKARRRTRIELAPMPVEQGTWDSPMERDPLNVSLLELGELALEAVTEAYKVEEIYSVNINFDWRRPTTLFATTEGSLILQRFCFSKPGGGMYSTSKKGGGEAVVEGLLTGQYGYEAIAEKTVVAEAGKAARRAVDGAEDRSKRPSVEPGRYDLVFGTGAVSSLVASTINAALSAPYALGEAMNSTGISFAGPPKDMLGSYQIASPLITVRADRTRPGGAATVGWDTEGVRPEVYTLVDRGVITDYHTDRESAAELGDWYRQRGTPVRSHGCVRREGMDLPVIQTPNLTLAHGTDEVSEDDLIRGVKKGFYLNDARGFTDQQTLSAQYWSMSARTIANGKLGHYVRDLAFQILMPQFWKNVDAIGGAASVKTFPVGTDGEADIDPAQSFPHSTFEMVPMRARRINILNIGQTA